jgi:hypothetical protein
VIIPECGCLPIPEEKVIKKWRLQPGKMFLVDLEKGRIIDDKELKESSPAPSPAEWIERIRVKLDEVETEKTAPLKSAVPLLDRQQARLYPGRHQVRFCRCRKRARSRPARWAMMPRWRSCRKS